MTLAGLIAAAAAIAAPTQSAALSDWDFQRLMQAAVSTSVASWTPPIRTICVQRELEAPLQLMKERSSLGWRNPSTVSVLANSSLNKSLAKALSTRAPAAPQKAMPPLPRRFVMFSSKGPRPAECVIEHIPPAGRKGHRKDLSAALTFTRPVFADGMAFINEVEDCPGLCGSGILWVFKKQNGKWAQVAEATLWVS